MNLYQPLWRVKAFSTLWITFFFTFWLMNIFLRTYFYKQNFQKKIWPKIYSGPDPDTDVFKSPDPQHFLSQTWFCKHISSTITAIQYVSTVRTVHYQHYTVSRIKVLCEPVPFKVGVGVFRPPEFFVSCLYIVHH
jgi:hypothetical protein